MDRLIAAALAAFALAGPCAAAAEPAGPFDVLNAIEGVWAVDPTDEADAGDFTCAKRPLAFAVAEDRRAVMAMEKGEPAPRVAMILDVQNAFPLGPAVSIVWANESAKRANGQPEAYIYFMESPNHLAFITASNYEKAMKAKGEGLMRSARLARCEHAGR